MWWLRSESWSCCPWRHHGYQPPRISAQRGGWRIQKLWRERSWDALLDAANYHTNGKKQMHWYELMCQSGGWEVERERVTSIRCRCSSGSIEQELYLRKIVIPKRAARAVVSLLMFSSSLLKKRKEGGRKGKWVLKDRQVFIQTNLLKFLQLWERYAYKYPRNKCRAGYTSCTASRTVCPTTTV